MILPLSTACMSPWFGENCENECHCLTGNCGITRGVCATSGCKSGYMEDSCSTGELSEQYDTCNYIFNTVMCT